MRLRRRARRPSAARVVAEANRPSNNVSLALRLGARARSGPSNNVLLGLVGWADWGARLREMPEKRYLFTPGPTPVPPEVLAALAQPIVHHRGPDFRIVYERCLARLKDVFRTEREVMLFTASGTGAFESAIANLLSPG